MPTREHARRALERLSRAAQYANWRPALLGDVTGAFKVPGEDLTYVRVVQGDVAITTARARNLAGIPEVPANAGLPVWIAQTINGEWIIREPRDARQRPIPVSTANVSTPPTAAQLSSAFGTPANLGDGFIGLVDDAGTGTAFYVCFTVGGVWAYEQLSIAV